MFVVTLWQTSALVRTELGTGYVVLTDKRLLLLKSGAQLDSITKLASRLTDITSKNTQTISVLDY